MKNGVRIGKACPLSKDVYTLFFLANIEHWYDVPLEHSDGDMDYLYGNILALVVAHAILITAVLRYACSITHEHEHNQRSNFIVFCKYTGSLLLQMTVLPKLNQGMQNLKYTLNHPWHFKRLWLTAFISCVQILICYYFEAVKLYALFKSDELEHLLINFSVLTVIANIDGFLYKTILEKNSKEFIKEKYNERNACDPEDDPEVEEEEDIVVEEDEEEDREDRDGEEREHKAQLKKINDEL